ncbi:MAG: hypothetical protein H6823_18390 [Planctomycetaceae bacterium]|nr:hypothetical protein [Planctomycetaceae bacterium]
MLPGHDGNSNIVYDEAGTVYCYDRKSQPMVRHKMSYIGHEPQRHTIKYRCPAMHEGWECPMAKICNAGKSYGLTVRVPQEIDVRRFPSLPRATEEVQTPVQRPDSGGASERTVEDLWGSRRRNLTGSRRFFIAAGRDHGGARIVRDAVSNDPASRRHAGPNELSPIAQALHGKVKERVPRVVVPRAKNDNPASVSAHTTSPVPRPFAESSQPETD